MDVLKLKIGRHLTSGNESHGSSFFPGRKGLRRDRHNRNAVKPSAFDSIIDTESVQVARPASPESEGSDEVEIVPRPDLEAQNGQTGAQRVTFVQTLFQHGGLRPGPRQQKKPAFPGLSLTEEQPGKPDCEDNDDDNVLAGVLKLLGGADVDKDEIGNLLKGKGNGRKKSRKNWQPIHFAAQQGKLAVLEQFIKRGADVETRDDDGWTALHFAASNERIEACRLLLDNHATVDARDNNGITPLRVAVAEVRNTELVQLLLEKGADARQRIKRDAPLLLFATNKVDPQIQEQLMEIAKILINHGADPNDCDEEGYSPLIDACNDGRIAMAEFLLQNGANTHHKMRDGKDALHASASVSKAELVRLLIHYGADPNVATANGWTPLHFAAQHDKEETLETIQALVENGANVNVQTENGATPLYLGAQSKRADVVKYLHLHGGNLETRPSTFRTPLMVAVIMGSLETAKYLIEAGADIHATETDTGFNIAHHACAQSNTDLLRLVLDTGVDAELAAKDGEEGTLRPMHLAVRNKNEDIVMILLEYGVKP